jgi:hypothetical protein
MAKFFVGQRVRCIASESGRFQGSEGVVINVNYSGGRRDGRFIENGLRVDHGAELPVLAEPWRWEPITPDGAQPSEFTTLQDLLESLEGVAA